MTTFQRGFERARRKAPMLFSTHRLLRSCRKKDLKLGEPEGPKHEKREVQYTTDFRFDLIGTAKQMRVVLSESTYPQKPVEDSSSLITIDRSEFSVTDRQVTVAS